MLPIIMYDISALDAGTKSCKDTVVTEISKIF